jgi:hypothetical protein
MLGRFRAKSATVDLDDLSLEVLDRDGEAAVEVLASGVAVDPDFGEFAADFGSFGCSTVGDAEAKRAIRVANAESLHHRFVSNSTAVEEVHARGIELAVVELGDPI